MKQRMSSEFIYQVFALLIAVIVVHALYVGVIRPSANAQIEKQMAQQAAGEEVITTRSFTVVIRDFEQESCFILLIWALAIMGYKGRRMLRERKVLEVRLLDIPEGTSVLPEDAREYSRALEALPEQEQDYLLPRTLLSALQRFATTGSIQAVSDTIKESCEIESDRLDSEMSMVRYIAWAIPSIGFIGTLCGPTSVTLFGGPLMSIGLLDINDSNLQLWHNDKRVQSPGYALLQGQHYLFGAAARSAARLQPRDINTRYWWQLGTDTLQPALGPARHTGDLVHAHLRQLHTEAQQPDEILLAVSGSMQHDQLALLLGIVQQCPFDAVGLVNRSFALASLHAVDGPLFHLELNRSAT